MNRLWALCGLCLLARAALAGDPIVYYWFEVDRTVVRPGESVEVTWWMQMAPAPGDPITFKGFPGTVVCFQFDIAHLTIDAGGWSGKISGEYLNPELINSQNNMGTPIGNTTYYVTPENWHPYENPIPVTDNPLWLYKFSWKPLAYEKFKAKATFLQPPINRIVFLAVPALNPTPPHWVLDKTWPYELRREAKFEVTDEVCVPDCDHSATLDIDDFICFQTQFAIGDPNADCDADEQLLVDDFICFQTAYAIGC